MLRAASLYVEHRFVNLIWGLEAFHRKSDAAKPPSEALARKIDRVVASAEPRDQRWLRHALKDAGELPLSQ